MTPCPVLYGLRPAGLFLCGLRLAGFFLYGLRLADQGPCGVPAGSLLRKTGSDHQPGPGGPHFIYNLQD